MTAYCGTCEKEVVPVEIGDGQFICEECKKKIGVAR